MFQNMWEEFYIDLFEDKENMLFSVGVLKFQETSKKYQNVIITKFPENSKKPGATRGILKLLTRSLELSLKVSKKLKFN